MRRVIFMVLLSGLAFLALNRAVTLPAATLINMGRLGTSAELPIFIAIEKGFFKEAGIELKFSEFTASGPMVAPLATNQLQIFSSGIGPGLYNAIARGMPIVIVSSSSRHLPGRSVEVLVVRSDLKEKIKRASDLKGRKVAINAPGSVLIYSLGKALATEGLALKDIDLVYMSFPDMVVALKTKAIEVAYQVEPMATLAEAEGHGVKWKTTGDFVKDPSPDTAGVHFNKDWARANPELAVNFLTAWLKGVRIYHEAVERGINREEMINIAIKYTRVKERWVYDKMNWAFINPNGLMDVKSIQDQIDWYFRNGHITHRLTEDQVVDNSYMEKVLKKLGEYKP